jgi:hypothetical protein
MAFDYTGAKVFHAECARVPHFTDAECEEMNRAKAHMMKECKK